MLGASGGLDLEPAGHFSATVRLGLDDALGPEAFVLEILPERVEVRAGGPAGASYGIAALRQLLPPTRTARPSSCRRRGSSRAAPSGTSPRSRGAGSCSTSSGTSCPCARFCGSST
ncbi:glycoside hydrolase family 20 zincin-like fold domain-containing protein [Luteimicrobium album]|uniref:glycoside hydrolase family 20 zincin-like fold domain-containing protein n=1 Tax=Luteimicrobium album TaxID=1054550 RepID=UPI003D67431A